LLNYLYLKLNFYKEVMKNLVENEINVILIDIDNDLFLYRLLIRWNIFFIFYGSMCLNFYHCNHNDFFFIIDNYHKYNLV
jgi:hypothetical protein